MKLPAEVRFEWNSRASRADGPSIIVPAKTGKLYTIQYGGCACFHCTVKGKLFKIPPVSYGDEGGSVFRPSLWYNHTLSHYFCRYYGDFEGKKEGATFLYNLIDKEIEDRCTEFYKEEILAGKPPKDPFARRWHTRYTHIKVVRSCAKNNEAMMLVSMKDKRTKQNVRGILTWDNCD
jgi:hypothetical protein